MRIDHPPMAFTAGFASSTNASPINAATDTSKIASTRNCTTSISRVAPTTFRSPTSRARSEARAVARLT